MCAALFCGITLASLAAFPSLPNAGTHVVTGDVTGDVTMKNDGVRMTLTNVSVDGKKTRQNAYWSFDTEALPDIQDGDRITVTAKIYEPSGQQNPYGFNFKQYLLQRGMSFGLYGSDNLQVEKNKATGFAHWTYRIRQALVKRLKNAIGEDWELAVAMTLGERASLPQEDVEAFRTLGIAHILSISGLHVGYVVMMIGWLLKLLYAPKRWHLPIYSIALVAYAVITGLSASVLRASILALMLLLAKRQRRPYDGLTSLSVAFALILLFRPLDLFSAGFILSFSAVLGIVLLRFPLVKVLARLPKWLREAFSVSLAAQIGITVPMMWFYQTVQPFSPLINIALVPLAGGMTMLFLLSLVFPFLGSLAALATKGFLALAHLLSNAPLLSLASIAPPWYIWCGAFLLMLLLSRYTCLKRSLRLGSAGVLLALMLLAGHLAFLTPPRYTLFANGQADGAIVETNDYTMVIDAGMNAGDMASYLRCRNRKVNALVITHLHADHLFGVKDLVDNGIAIENIYLPYGYDAFEWDEKAEEYLAMLDAPVTLLSKGDEIPYAQVLWPIAGALPLSPDGNNISLSLLVSLDNLPILTMGDMTSAYEMYALAPASVLKVSHHGSSGSTSRSFIEAVAPSVALISCTESAFLPSEKTLDRLAAISVFKTSETGAITITPKDEGFSVQTFLK